MSDDTTPKPPEIDTANTFLVGIRGETLVILRPPRSPISKAEALTFAAYLVSMAEDEDGQFQRVLNAVQNT